MVFGTPLAGADPYAWLRAGESFFDFAGRDYPQDLAHRCGALSRLGKGFQDLLASRANGSTKIEVMCFYEEQETTFQLDNSFYKVRHLSPMPIKVGNVDPADDAKGCPPRAGLPRTIPQRADPRQPRRHVQVQPER